MIVAFVAGLAFFVIGVLAIHDAMGRAFWGLAAAVILLPVAVKGIGGVAAKRDELDLYAFEIACVPVLVGTFFTSGLNAAIVVGSIAFSLMGLLSLLVRIGIPATFAVGLLVIQSILFLTWPIWAANLLTKFDSQWLVDLLVKVGPLFAINAAIDPTDAFTHRPLAYRLMNLGQDIPYQMPASIWASVILHGVVGLPGVLLGWSRRTKGSKGREVEQLGVGTGQNGR